MAKVWGGGTDVILGGSECKCENRGGVNFFSNSRKLKMMVGVKVFAMKNIDTERILVGGAFDIRAILTLFRDFTLS